MKRNKYTLGIYVGHDSAVALAKNGKLIAASTEERFTGLKHYSSLPVRSLDFCLKKADIKIEEVSEIIIPTIGSQENVEVLLGRLKQGVVKKELGNKNKNLLDYFRYFMIGIFRLLNLWTPLIPPAYFKTYNYPKNKPIVYIEHHLAHAASAYYTSGFQEKTLIVCADGSGDGLSTSIWIGEDGQLTPVLRVGREGSFGAFLGLITEALGWWVGDGEQKTMALAAKGNTHVTEGLLDDFAPLYDNGKLKKGYNWGFPGIWEDMGGSHFHFSDTDRIVSLIKKYGRENIAAEAQRLIETQLTDLIKYWIKKENVKYLATSGAVFLNSKLNLKILKLNLLDKYYIFPDAGESGVAAGSALYGYFSQTKEQAPALDDINLGPSYSNVEIEKILKTRKIDYQYLKGNNFIDTIAGLLTDNQAVGWFQGGAEIGSRSLGARSILMSPLKTENKLTLNNLKRRQEHLPFVITIPDVLAGEYLNTGSSNLADALIACDIKSPSKILLAATNTDQTICPQALRRKDNPLFYDLLQAFKKLTGAPGLLNTSFNVSGNSTVGSPEEAIQCFYNTSLDHLVLGNYLISKK